MSSPSTKSFSSSLSKDVLAFSSKLGLNAPSSSNSQQDGFDDRDFRPKKSSNKNKLGKRERKLKKSASSSEAFRRPDLSIDQEHAYKKHSLQQQKAQKTKPKTQQYNNNNNNKQHTRFGGNGGDAAGGSGASIGPVGRRVWNEGAGPIPDSLLGESSAALSDLDEALSGSWYDICDKLKDKKVNGGHTSRLSESIVEDLRAKGERLVGDFTQRSEQYRKKYGGQDAQWLMTARTKGTVRDKIAAASLLVQQNVISNIDSLEMLVSWVVRNKGSRDGIGHAVDALSELFSTTLLPDRKLKYFSDQSFPNAARSNKKKQMSSSTSSGVDEKLLIVYYVEDRIKALYHEFVESLEALTKDNLEFLKQRAMKTAFTLLKTKPEQESRLLSILVNKLGDPSRKIASNAVYLMHSLLEEHPGMKVIVVQDVENFLFRPGLSQRAQYTSIIFLNQIILSKNEFEGGSKLAEKLINLYFGFFQILISQQNNNKKKFKITSGGDGKGMRDKGSSNMKDKGEGSSTTTTTTGIDSKILGALLTGANRAFPYVSATEIDALIDTHSPKLFQLVHGPNFGTCVQALILLYQLYNTRLSLSDRYYRALYSALLKPEILVSNKAPLFLSVLFKSLKADINKVRVATFLNRLVQVSAEAKSNFTCGALLLVSETMKHFPALWAYVNESAASSREKFRDMEEDEDEDEKDAEKAEEGKEEKENGEEDTSSSSSEEEEPEDALVKGYDMLKRDPQHSGMEESCFWELSLLSSHFHPSTSIMARTLLAGTHIVYNGDPLKDLNAVSFLGKFVQKKPKSVSSKFSSKQAEQDAEAMAANSIGSANFAELDENVVNPEDLFFHKYYSQKVREVVRKDASKAVQDLGDDDDDDDDDVDPDYSNLGNAMFANGGENSDDSGEISVSESDLEDSINDGNSDENGEADEEADSEDMGDKEVSSIVEMEDMELQDEEGPIKKLASGSDDGPFASAEDFAEQIEKDLMNSKQNLDEFLANDKKRKGKTGDKRKKKKKKKASA